MISVHHGDCLDVIPTLGVLVDAVVTDPPYGLEFMGMEWDKLAPKIGRADLRPSDKSRSPIKSKFKDGVGTRIGTPKKNPRCKVCGRLSWDHEKYRCHCVVPDFDFRASEYAREMQAMFEAWAREIYTILRPGGFLVAFGGTRTYHRLACAIEDAGFVIQDTIAWLYGSGFPKRRDMLKPAFEPIVLAYKPGGKRTMQVDECRIGTTKRVPGSLSTTPNKIYGAGIGSYCQDGSEGGHDPNLGRWPANVCHDGSEEVTETFPVTFSGALNAGHKQGAGSWGAIGGDIIARDYGNDTGSAARFFYCAKADKQDRWGSRHPTVKPVELMKWLVALVTPPGGLVLDPFAGSGTTGVAALATGRNAILIEREAAYVADIRERLAFYEGGGMHSIQAKNRNRGNGVGALRDGGRGRPMADHGPLFAVPFNDALDCALSYEAAIQAIGERVKAGEPLPTTGYFARHRNPTAAIQMEFPYAAE